MISLTHDLDGGMTTMIPTIAAFQVTMISLVFICLRIIRQWLSRSCGGLRDSSIGNSVDRCSLGLGCLCLLPNTIIVAPRLALLLWFVARARRSSRKSTRRRPSSPWKKVALVLKCWYRVTICVSESVSVFCYCWGKSCN